MAVKDIQFKIEVDASQAVKNLAEYKKTVEGIDKKIADLRKQMKEEGADTNTLGQEIARLTEKKKAYNKEIASTSHIIQNEIIPESDKYRNSLKALRAELSAAKDELAGIELGSDAWERQAVHVKELNDRVSQAEQAYGVYTRNVGNYASAFNGLGVSVQQVARELPSLAMGANTFFLAISNNLPILADNIKTAREEYKMSVAQGEEATPVWKQLLSSIASWQTLMVVVITLLSTHGKEVVEFAKSLFKQKEAFDASAQAASDYHKTIAEGRVEAQKEITRLEAMYEAATDASKGMDLRREAVKALQKEYPSYLGNMSEEEIMTGKAAGAYSALKDRLLEVAHTRAVMEKLTELNTAKLSDEYQALVDAQKAFDKEDARRRARVEDVKSGKAGISFTIISMREERKALEEALKGFAEKYGIQGESLADVNAYIEQSLNKLKGSITTFNTEVTEAEVEMGKVVEQVNTDLYNADAEAIERKKSLLTMKAQLEFHAAEELEARLFQIKQDAQRERLDLDLANGKISAEEYGLSLALLAKEEEDFKAEQIARLNDHATQMRDVMIELAGGLSMQGKLAELEAQYEQAFETLAKDAKISADERAYYEEQLAKELARKKEEIFKESEEKNTETKLSELEKRQILEQEYTAAATELAYSLNDAFNAFADARLQRAEQDNEKEKNDLQKRLDAGIISQKQYDKEVAKLDEQLAEKKAKIVREQAIREKALNVMQIAMNTAAAVMRIWADVPKVDFGASTGVLTAMAIAAGAAQTAAVLAAPIPEARTGGMVMGRTHENGGVLMNLEDQERIIGAKPSKAFPELLNLIAYIGNHAQMPNTGYAARSMMVSAGGGAGGGAIDADLLAQKIGEQVSDAVRQMPIYLSLTELREEQEVMARIEESAKI